MHYVIRNRPSNKSECKKKHLCKHDIHIIIMRDQKKESERERDEKSNNLCKKLWISSKNIPFHFKLFLLYFCIIACSMLFCFCIIQRTGAFSAFRIFRGAKFLGSFEKYRSNFVLFYFWTYKINISFFLFSLQLCEWKSHLNMELMRGIRCVVKYVVVCGIYKTFCI